ISGATTNAMYIIGIKYDGKSVIGSPAPNPATVHYDFETFLNNTLVDKDMNGVDLVRTRTSDSSGLGTQPASGDGAVSVVDQVAPVQLDDNLVVGQTAQPDDNLIVDQTAQPADWWSSTPLDDSLVELVDDLVVV